MHSISAAILILLLSMGSAQAGAKRCAGDADCDGLSNQEERTLGTNRWRADSDDDGLTDVFEARRLGTSPMVEDSDGDGAGDGDEVCDGTDPQDGDGEHKDGEPEGEDENPRIAGPVDTVDAATMTITIFGCLAIDVSGAALRGAESLGDIVPGSFVEVALDGSKLPMLVATKVAVHEEPRTDEDGEGEGDEPCDEDSPE